MDVFKLNGKAYNVNVLELTESFSILYSDNTTRTLAPGAPLYLAPLGTFISHVITVSCKKGHEEECDSLYEFLLIPRYKGINVKVVHGQESIEYKAYVSQGERPLKRIDEKSGKVYWDKLKINIIPMKAQVLP